MSHIFISYIRENSEVVERLAADLRAAGADVWLDRNDIAPGQNWQEAIRRAIQSGAYFIACFSPEYLSKTSSYMTEELVLAIEELRVRSSGRGWFIPVRLADCPIPDRPIGDGETLQSIQWVDLFPDWVYGLRQIKAAVRGALRSTLLQSPWLGITFRQLNEACTLLKCDDESVQVLLQPEPFEIRLPIAKKGDSVRMSGSYDPIIFGQIAHDMPLDDVPYFRSGTGMADTTFGGGNFWIDAEAHMHLDWGARLTPHPDGGGLVLVNVIYRLHEEPAAMPRRRDLYVVIMVGSPDESVAANWNFERFTLSFW